MSDEIHDYRKEVICGFRLPKPPLDRNRYPHWYLTQPKRYRSKLRRDPNGTARQRAAHRRWEADIEALRAYRTDVRRFCREVIPVLIEAPRFKK